MALGVRTLASNTATTDGATTLSVSPTGMEQFDWLIIGVCSAGGTGAHTNTAGGLSRATAADIAGGTVTVASTWKKKCGAGEAGPYTFSFGGSTRRAVIIAVAYSGGDATDIVESAPAGVASGASDSSLAVPGVDPAGLGTTHLVWEFSRTAGGVQQDFNAITNYPETVEVSSTHATNANANAAVSTRALPNANATGDITFSVVTADRLSGTSVLLKPGLQTVAIGQVTETDSAGVLTRRHTYVIGQVTETDSAAVITPVQTGGGQTIAVGQVTETDSAGVITVRKTVILGQATETDAAGIVTMRKTIAVGQVTETDTAGVVSPMRVYDVGQAVETDTAGALETAKTVTVNRATETDSAGTVIATHVITVGQATETDVAGALEVAKAADVAQVVETDSAGTVTARETFALGQAVETDTASAITFSKTVHLGQVTELDTAQQITSQGTKVIEVVKVTETDSAGTITALKTVDVAQVTETDTAGAVEAAKTAAVGRAVENDLAGVVSPRHTTAIGQVSETNVALPLGALSTVGVAQTTEIDTAQPITSSGGAAPEPGTEVDLVTLAFIIVTGVGQCVVDALAETEGGPPARACLAVPGEIAWDNCECGQFAQSITSDTPAQTNMTAATSSPFSGCGPPLLVMDVTASITRCVPGIDSTGHPPSCAALLDAARILEDDREAMRQAITCCLKTLFEAYRISGYTVGASVTVGPQGECAGVNITYQFGLSRACC